MLLSKILEGIEFKNIKGENCEIDDITIDSRNVKNNFLFICIKGLNVDGHDYIETAIKNGASAIICDKELEKYPNDITIIEVINSREALAKIAINFTENAVNGLRIIGVTGTNGKTSTTFFLESILKENGRKCGVIGTSGAFIDSIPMDISYLTSTTPDTIELHKIFKEMKNNGVQDVLMEVSSHALDLKKVDGINFKLAIFTNLTQDHLDYHGTFENYLEAKSKLFKMCEYGIINADDKYSQNIIDNANCKIITFGKDNISDYMAEHIHLTKYGANFKVRIDNIDYNFDLHIPGMFSVYNVLGAISACKTLGICIEIIQSGVSNIKGVPGRIQSIKNEKDISIFIDYAHSPNGLENIIKNVKEFTESRIITVFGCGGERDRVKRPIMGKIASDLSDICVITSDNPRSENPEGIILEIEKGIENKNCIYEKISDRYDAIKKAIELSEHGDSIIIAGKGNENYQEFENRRRIHFDDAEVVKELLNQL